MSQLDRFTNAARKAWPRTLRSRIVASVALLLLIGFAAVGLITTLAVHRVLLDRLDEQLSAAGSRFAVSLEHNDKDADNGAGQFDTVEGQATGTLGARILDGRVTAAAVVGHHDATGKLSAAAQRVLARLPLSNTARSVHLPGLGAYRVIVVSGRDGDQQVTGLPVEPVRETTHQLVLIEAAVFAAAVLLIGVASTVVVRLTLRPLGRVADTAAKVARLPLATGLVSLPDRAPAGPAGSEVATVSAAFNTMLEVVESALIERHDGAERLRRFIADASHELRTPVAVVRSQAEYARRVGGNDLPDEVSHALERIGVQSERMGHLVEDLLLLARLDSGRPLAHDDVDVTRLVLDAVTDAEIAAADHRWQLDLPATPVLVKGDEHALHQVLANLLANVRVHTPAGTNVLTTLRQGTESVTVTIDDDGPGIPADIAAHAFERFVRGATDRRQRSHTTGSSGLGLPIVAAIVGAHHGAVSLGAHHGAGSRSGTPAGTHVSVTLPLRANGEQDR